MCGPDRRDLVQGRQRELRVVGDIKNGKIALQERPGKAAESNGHKKELTERSGIADFHHGCIVAVCADQRQDALAERKG